MTEERLQQPGPLAEERLQQPGPLAEERQRQLSQPGALAEERLQETLVEKGTVRRAEDKLRVRPKPSVLDLEP